MDFPPLCKDLVLRKKRRYIFQTGIALNIKFIGRLYDFCPLAINDYALYPAVIQIASGRLGRTLPAPDFLVKATFGVRT